MGFYVPGEIAFLCDVDDRRAAESVKKFPQAKYYKDWRELYDKEHKNFDVSKLAAQYGSGGHKLAAPFRIRGTLDRAPGGFVVNMEV